MKCKNRPLLRKIMWDLEQKPLNEKFEPPVNVIKRNNFYNYKILSLEIQKVKATFTQNSIDLKLPLNSCGLFSLILISVASNGCPILFNNNISN